MKKILAVIFVVSFTLSACSSDKDFQQGVEKYETGTYESLNESRTYFLNYLENDPDNKDAKDWLSKVESKLADAAKDEIETLNKNLDFEKATEVAGTLVEIDPSEENLNAQSLMQSNYENQVEFDTFSDFMEEKYEELYSVFTVWRQSLESSVLNKKKSVELKNVIRESLPKISKIRGEIQEQNLIIKDENYIAAQSELFKYVNNIEDSMTSTLSDEALEKASDFESSMSAFSPEVFNNTFVSIQNDINKYLNQIVDDVKVLNVKGTLDFGKTPDETEVEKDDADQEDVE